MLFKNTLIDADNKLISADNINEKIRQNRISFFKKHNIDPRRLVNIAGIHNTNIAIIDDSNLGGGSLNSNTRIPDTDGLITDVKILI